MSTDHLSVNTGLEFMTPLLVLISTVVSYLLARRAETKAEQVKRTLHQSQEATNVKLESVATKAAEVKKAMDTKLEAIQQTGITTHGLVNNQMRIVLQALAVVSRRLAEATEDPADLKAAEAAEESLREHDLKQAQVDEAQRQTHPT